MNKAKKKPPVSIPYFAYEGSMFRMEQIIKRQTAAMVCSFALSALLIALQFRQHKE